MGGFSKTRKALITLPVAVSSCRMLQGLLTRLRQAATSRDSRPRTPEGVRIYAVGDIHGRADLLRSLLDQIAVDVRTAGAPRKLLIYLGDYVDRGLESRQVIELLLRGPPAGFEVVYLKGNHEQALLRFLEDADFGAEWTHFGGLETLYSYGVTDLAARMDRESFCETRDQFEAFLPRTHRDFLGRLELSACLGDYFFVHAGVRPGVALEDQREEDLLAIRQDFTRSTASFGKVVVHGHSVREEPERHRNRINVDTGAYMTDHLTCVVLDGVEQRFLQTGSTARDARRMRLHSGQLREYVERSLTVVALAVALACAGGAASPPPPVGATPPGDPARAAEAEAAPESAYRLGSGDQLRVIVFGEEELSGEFEVDDTGTISLPLIGQVGAEDRTLRSFEKAVEERLRDGYLKDPRVSAEVLNYRPFYIIGEVDEDGKYPFVSGMHVLNAVALAGGYTYRANTRKVFITRGVEEGEFPATHETRVEPGDLIRVPERFF